MADSRVPSKEYRRQYRDLLPEILPAIERAFSDDDPILGRAVEQFERDYAHAVGTRECVGVNSGTDALSLSLRALGVGPGTEVITAANTFIATVSAIASVGARAVLVDPSPETMNLEAPTAAAAVTSRTRAIVPVHLYGMPCDLPALRRAVGRDIAIVEDAAQAHGAILPDGSRAGASGHAGCFSFHPSKNLGAFGDAGAVTTDDADLAERLRVLRNLGKHSKYAVRSLTGNSKLDTLQAVILQAKLRHLESWIERRNRHAQRYRRALAAIDGLSLPPEPTAGRHAYHLFVVRLADRPARDRLREHLAGRGIKASLHYPIPPHLQELDVDLGYRAGDFPVAERCADTVLSLPISHELTEGEIDRVIQAVEEAPR